MEAYLLYSVQLVRYPLLTCISEYGCKRYSFNKHYDRNRVPKSKIKSHGSTINWQRKRSETTAH